MNLFPLIHRSKKTQSFANPLNGLTFHNDSIVQSVHRQGYSTISYNQTNTNRSNVTSLKTKSDNKLKAQRQESSLSKMGYLPLKSSKTIRQATLFDSHDASALVNNLSSSVKSNQFIYPQVEIIPLHLINKYQDIARFTMHMHLEKYFKFYFTNDFKHNSKKLNSILEKYIPFFKKYDMLDKQIIKKKWPKEFWQIKTLKELLDCVQKYQKPHQYWIKYILILIQIHFIPHVSLRKTTLQNLILIIIMQIKHQFKINQPKGQLVLLLQSGEIVQDFIDIPLSASKIYLTKKEDNPQLTVKAFYEFKGMIKAYEQDCKKKGLVIRLRKHFRKEIVSDKYNDDTINYDMDYSSKEKERKILLHRAMKILQKKKNHQMQPKIMNQSTARPKSQQQVWKQQNIEDSSYHDMSLSKFSYHINLNNQAISRQIKKNFDKYHELSLKENQKINENEIYLFILQKHHPTISAIINNTFHAMKLKRVYQILLNEKIADNHEIAKTTIEWKQFLQFSILTHKNLKKLIELPDCLHLVRNFVEDYLEMEDQYFRDELTSKLYHIVEGDSSALSLMQEVIWNWLVNNGFVDKGVIQRQFFWIYTSKSNIFYLLMVEMIFGTFQTTPLDLAYELLI